MGNLVEKDFDFESELKRADKLVHDLMMDSGVMSDFALFGFLFVASSALSAALPHVRERLVCSDLNVSLCKDS